jgi:hypothetical protein
VSVVLSTLGFIAAAAILGLFASNSEDLVSILIWIFTPLGLYVALIMGLRRYFYTASLFVFHVAFTGFVCYVYLNRREVVTEPEFVFSTFTDSNLQTSISVLCFATIAVLVPWTALAGRTAMISKLSVRAVAAETIGRLDSISWNWIILMLVISPLTSIFLFITNPSVLDVSYPYEYEQQWVPFEVFKIPVIMASLVLATVYAKRVSSRRNDVVIMNMARLNVLFVTTLILVLIGARGMFTFLWLIIGLFEVFLRLRKKGSVLWGLFFVGLSWFAFQSWPYMRWYLSLLPFPQVMWDALQIGIGYKSTVAAAYQEGIVLGQFTMIGASLFHLLYVVQLIHDGISLHGETFINLLPQFLPSWLDGVLWDRPISDGWLLAEHYHHGGGFLVVANAYWNGGIWVTASFMCALSIIFVGFDRHLAGRRTGTIYRVAYWFWLPVMMVQIGYGIEGLVRVVELLAAAIVIEHLFARGVMRRGSDPSGSWPPVRRSRVLTGSE